MASAYKLNFFLWEAYNRTFAPYSDTQLSESWSGMPQGFPEISLETSFRAMDTFVNPAVLGTRANWVVAVANDGHHSGIWAFGGSMGSTGLYLAVNTLAQSVSCFQKSGKLYVAYGTISEGIDGEWPLALCICVCVCLCDCVYMHVLVCRGAQRSWCARITAALSGFHVVRMTFTLSWLGTPIFVRTMLSNCLICMVCEGSDRILPSWIQHVSKLFLSSPKACFLFFRSMACAHMLHS
jgi:hypothetical protein